MISRLKRLNWTRRRWILTSLAGLVLACCLCSVPVVLLTPDATATPAAEIASVDIAPIEATEAIEPTATAAPTDTPAPTATPEPTSTPEPTATPKPTATPTPAPEPIVLEGQGDSVVNVEKWPGPAILKIEAPQNSSNFAVWNYDANGDRIELLVNEIGAYQGIVPIDIRSSYPDTTRLEINASSAWRIEVMPFTLDYITIITVPGTYTGAGDDVIALDGIPDLGIFNYPGDSNFAVHAIGEYIDLIVNEIGPYSGTVIIPRDTIVLSVQAEGEWTVELTEP